jgi:hypothetical protein
MQYTTTKCNCYIEIEIRVDELGSSPSNLLLFTTCRIFPDLSFLIFFDFFETIFVFNYLILHFDSYRFIKR